MMRPFVVCAATAWILFSGHAWARTFGEIEAALPPQLAIEPTGISGKVQKPGAFVAKFTIRNAGGQVLNWQFTAKPSWLSVSPSQGKLEHKKAQEVTVTVQSHGIKPGEVQGMLKIRATDQKSNSVQVATGSSAEIAVTVRIAAPPPPRTFLVEKPTGGSAQAKGGELARRAELESGRDRGMVESAVEAELPPAAASREADLPFTRKLRGLGVRAGVLLPGSASAQDFSSGPRIAVFWRPVLESWKFGYELEASYTATESDSGVVESTILAAQASALWHFWRTESISLYGSAGATVFSESAEGDTMNETALVGSVDVGVGVTFTHYDLRLDYSTFLGSDNIGGALAASLGVMF